MQIVIPSSDVTQWALQGCLWLLDRHWPAHPPVVIGGYTPPPFPLPPYAEFRRLGDFADFPANRWSDGLMALLDTLADDVILIHFDDFWLVEDVDDAAVRLLYEHMVASPYLARIDLTTDRLYAATMCRAGSLGPLNLVSTPPNTPYQLSFQTGLWRRAALRQYLVPGETAGETEVRGSYRMTLANANVLGTMEAPVKYKIVVQHGQVRIYEPGYQVPAVNLPDADLAELERLGYTTP